MNKVNRLVISRRDFKQDDELYAKVGQQVRLLLETGNTVVLRDEEEKGGTIVVDFMPSDGDVRPFWLVDSEWKSALNTHVDIEVRQAQKVVKAMQNTDVIMKKLGFDIGTPDDDNDDKGNNGGSFGGGPVGDA